MFRTIGSRFSGTAVSPHKNIHLPRDIKGNMIDLAIGIIIGGAFSGIVFKKVRRNTDLDPKCL